MAKKKTTYLLDSAFYGCSHRVNGKQIELHDETSQTDLKRVYDSGMTKYIKTIESDEQKSEQQSE